MPTASGGFTTRGRCLLAAGFAAAACALLLDERDLLRIATFAIVLPLLATLVAGRAQAGLRAGRDLLPARIPAGAGCVVHLAVRSTRWLGSGLLLEDGVPPALGNRPVFAVERLPRNRATRLRYSLHQVQRGVHYLGPLAARITDPFGLVEYRCALAGHSRLVVTPVVVPLTGMPTGGGLDSSAEDAAFSASSVRCGPGEDTVVVRSYRQGDELRKVHWRSTARRDELMVRVEEQPWRGDIAVLLDHRTAAHRGSGPDSSFEYAVSLAASVCVHLQRHGSRVRLITADGQLQTDAADTPDCPTDTILDALSALHPSDRKELLCGLALDEARVGTQQLVAVLGAATVEQLVRHRRHELRRHAVLLDVRAWEAGPDRSLAGLRDPAETARGLVAAGWSVTVARPEQPIWWVWERLCLRAQSTLRT